MTKPRLTESEVLFEEYLTTHNYAEWTHEATIEGKLRKPDYRLEFGGSSFFFEVKEFDSALRLLDSGRTMPTAP